MANNDRYIVTGRYVDVDDKRVTLGYQIKCSDPNKSGKCTPELLAYLCGLGKVDNCAVKVNGMDISFTGRGIKMTELPTVEVRNNKRKPVNASAELRVAANDIVNGSTASNSVYFLSAFKVYTHLLLRLRREYTHMHFSYLDAARSIKETKFIFTSKRRNNKKYALILYLQSGDNSNAFIHLRLELKDWVNHNVIDSIDRYNIGFEQAIKDVNDFSSKLAKDYYKILSSADYDEYKDADIGSLDIAVSSSSNFVPMVIQKFSTCYVDFNIAKVTFATNEKDKNVGMEILFRCGGSKVSSKTLFKYTFTSKYDVPLKVGGDVRMSLFAIDRSSGNSRLIVSYNDDEMMQHMKTPNGIFDALADKLKEYVES